MSAPATTELTVVVLDCPLRHEKDYTNYPERLPAVGDAQSCWSSCDAAGRITRRVLRIERREVHIFEVDPERQARVCRWCGDFEFGSTHRVRD